jgi:hypothetical protein
VCTTNLTEVFLGDPAVVHGSFVHLVPRMMAAAVIGTSSMCVAGQLAGKDDPRDDSPDFLAGCGGNPAQLPAGRCDAAGAGPRHLQPGGVEGGGQPVVVGLRGRLSSEADAAEQSRDVLMFRAQAAP